MWWLITSGAITFGCIYGYLRGWIGRQGTQIVSFAIIALPSLRELLRHSDRSLMFVVTLAQMVFTAVLITVVIMRVRRAQDVDQHAHRSEA